VVNELFCSDLRQWFQTAVNPDW